MVVGYNKSSTVLNGGKEAGFIDKESLEDDVVWEHPPSKQTGSTVIPSEFLIPISLYHYHDYPMPMMECSVCGYPSHLASPRWSKDQENHRLAEGRYPHGGSTWHNKVQDVHGHKENSV